MSKRITPDNDYDRIAENLHLFGGGAIDDQTTFNKVYDEYMSGAGKDVNQKKFKDKVRSKYAKKYKITTSDGKTFKKAGGKNLAKDRQTRAKRVTKNKKEYIKAGAKNIDLIGVDTPPRIKLVILKVRGKTQKRYRDERGRFTKKPTRR